MTLVMFQLSNITPQSGTDDLFWPLFWRGVVTVMMYLPLSLASLSSLPKQDIAAGTGFYNLTRQLGSSVGIAIITTLLDRREAFHRAILTEHVTPYDSLTNERLDLLSGAMQSGGIDAQTAHQQALALISQSVSTQATVMSYADIFRFVGVVFLCSLPLLLFLEKGKSGNVTSAH